MLFSFSCTRAKTNRRIDYNSLKTAYSGAICGVRGVVDVFVAAVVP